MSDFYEGLRDDTVIPLISQFGQTITRVRVQDTSTWVKEYVPSEGRYRWRNTESGAVQYTEPTGTSTTTTGQGVITSFEDSLIDGTLIQRGDKLLLSQNIGAPAANDVYTVSGVSYNYIRHETVSPGGVDVLYKIQLRI